MASELNELTHDELIQLVEYQRHDWDLMNEFINAQATMFGWCDEYEERLLKYNPSFKVLKAHGRVPEGKRVSVRNAFSARRLVMAHVVNTLAHYGIELPDGALCGVVRDHRALADAHEQLIEHLRSPRGEH
jgi:hypothetical protein